MLNSLTTIILGPYDMISQQISIFFDWLVLKGVREDTLIIILVAGGISVLLLILGLLLALFKFLRKNKAEKPAKEKKSKKAKAPKSPQSAHVKGPDPRFAIFKKRKNKKAQKVSAEPPVADPNVESLTEIERDMLALKELFDAGHIDAKVYVEETRKLYEKAQQLI